MQMCKYLSQDKRNILPILIGLVFVISSLFKWIGIRTFALTVDAFCSFLGYDWLYGHGLLLAVLICSAELLLGAVAFLPKVRRYVVWIYPVLLGYFTYITYLNLVSLYGQIESCGCFGEVIHLTPSESFWKNVVLLAVSLMAIPLSLYERRKTI